MAINKLKKINVRSPYYITVDDLRDADVAPTEPVDREFETSCGDTVSVGVDVGVRKYNISLTGKQLGDYTVTFSNIKIPIKYRIGYADNMPSYSTAGLDNYADQWLEATGESPTLTESSGNPNGVSAIATYTSTQSDIDTYGETIRLEILQPIVTENYSFVSSCPANAVDLAPSVTGIITTIAVDVVNVESDDVGELYINNIKINTSGQLQHNDSDGYFKSIGRFKVGFTTRFIMDDSESVASSGYTSNLFAIRNSFNDGFGSGFSIPDETDTGQGWQTKAYYKPTSILSSGVNYLRYEKGNTNKEHIVTVMISQFKVVNGIVLGNNEQESVPTIYSTFRLYDVQQTVEARFEGSNETRLRAVSDPISLLEGTIGDTGGELITFPWNIRNY